MATEKAYAWNEGSAGIPRRTVVSPVAEQCATAQCGSDHDWDEADPVLAGWVRILVAGSDEPQRWFCSARCASVGIARAQLRMDGRPDHEDLSLLVKRRGGPGKKTPAPARRGGV
jgi:hypothetical protein